MQPNRQLNWLVPLVALLALAASSTGLFDFEPLPGAILAAVVLISVLYVAVTEWVKRRIYRI